MRFPTLLFEATVPALVFESIAGNGASVPFEVATNKDTQTLTEQRLDEPITFYIYDQVHHARRAAIDESKDDGGLSRRVRRLIWHIQT